MQYNLVHLFILGRSYGFFFIMGVDLDLHRHSKVIEYIRLIQVNIIC